MTPSLGEAQIFDVMRQGLWVAVKISTPILTMALVTGVVIGLFQALTSIQEMTLTFVPKLAAMIACFWVSMSFMTSVLIHFYQEVIISFVAGG